MGMAASQARLLTITARIADNELRSQTINNAKMRLATQSAQASDEYVSALNSSKLMFANNTADGQSQTQALSFNSLTQYSPYNTQYGIVNSAGLIMVNEEEAKIFENNKNSLEDYLKAHNLEYTTTFFDDDKGKLTDKICTFYSGADSEKPSEPLYRTIQEGLVGKSNDELKKMYEQSISQEASIEYLNYQKAAKNLYSMSTKILEKIDAKIADKLYGDKTESDFIDEITGAVKVDDKTNSVNNANTVKTKLNEITGNYVNSKGESYLTADGQKEVKDFINSLTDNKSIPGVSEKTAGYADNFEKSDMDISYSYYTDAKTNTQTVKDYTITDGDFIITITMGKDDKGKPTDKIESAKITLANASNSDSRTFIVNSINSSTNNADAKIDLTNSDNFKLKYNNNGEITNEDDIKNAFMNVLSNAVIIDTETDETTNTKTSSYTYYEGNSGNMKKYDLVQDTAEEKEGLYEDFISEYFGLLKQYTNINDADFEDEEFKKAQEEFANLYGQSVCDATCKETKNYDYLLDMDKFAKKINLYDLLQKDEKGKITNPAFESVVNSYVMDKALDVLGEPKYAWVDSTDTTNTGNADSKAQWYSNLFNRMQDGYKVLENGLASSTDWMEYALESGLVTMEQVDLSYNWISLDYKTCSAITEETDNSAEVAKAEAKYQRAMNDIEAKDSMYDMQLKNIDTEHNALQTEYDSVKKAMDKNIDRTMKFCQNG